MENPQCERSLGDWKLDSISAGQQLLRKGCVVRVAPLDTKWHGEGRRGAGSWGGAAHVTSWH